MQFFVRIWVEVDAEDAEDAHRKAVAGEWEFDSVDEDGIIAGEDF
jgi:hypothetical protein